MFFAAFERKWWKAGTNSEQSGDSSSKNEEITSDESIETNSDTVNLLPKDWVEPEVLNKSIEDEVLEEDDEDLEEEDVFSNEENFEQMDPHAPPAFEFDDSCDDEDEKSVRKSKAKIERVKEFFNTEILYRYDILEDDIRDAIKGDYLVELSGDQSGTWHLNFARDVSASQNNLEKFQPIVKFNCDSRDFIDIINGRLNCQIALASKRVKIVGDARKASLLQNIFAPV